MTEVKINKDTNGRDPAIDLLRGIAMIMVFIFHYGATFYFPPATQFGQMGCQLFFFASGYSCCFSGEKSGNALAFWKKRFCSLAPVFYTAIIVYWGVYLIVNLFITDRTIFNTEVGFWSFFCNFLLIHGVVPFCNNTVYPGAWFIGTVVILYLLHPLFQKIYRKRRRTHLVTILLTLIFLLISVLVNYLMTGTFVVENNSFTYYLFTTQAGCYLLGMDLFYCEKKPEKVSVILPAALFFLLAALWLYYAELSVSYLLVSFATGLFSFFFYLLLKRIRTVSRFLKMICRIGENSYYVFLTHTVIVWSLAKAMVRLLSGLGIQDYMVSFYLLLVPCMILSWFLACLFRKVMEKEQKILHGIFRRR